MHLCNESCKQTDKLEGIYFTCYECASETLVLSAAKEHNEIWLIVEAFKLVVPDDKGGKLANVTPNTRKVFDSVFGENSLFNFTCDQCKCNNIVDDDEKKKQINVRNAKILELEAELAEKTKIIQEMADSDDSPNELSTFKIDDVTPTTEAIRTMSNKIISNVRKLLANEIGKLTTHVTDECKKTRIQGKKVLSELEATKGVIKKPHNPFARNNNENQTPNTNAPDEIVLNDDEQQQQQT